MTAPAPHTPVLVDRVAALLADTPPGVVVDATVGAAGHASAIVRERLARHGEAHLVGIDRDRDALALAAGALEALAGGAGGRVRVELAHARFDALAEVLDERGIGLAAGVLLDLGISSMHVDQPERGFSYRHEGPLDMRMDGDQPWRAADLVNDLPVAELAALLRDYGEERFADRIARAIVAARPLATTTELADVVRDAIPAAARRHGGHPATRTFQALRIAVNDELAVLDAVLPTAIDRLLPGGVLVVLSYHSLEDRRVKRAFAQAVDPCVCPPGLPRCSCGRVPTVEHVVRRPLRPAAAELAANPRAASARLRAVRRIAGPGHTEMFERIGQSS